MRKGIFLFFLSAGSWLAEARAHGELHPRIEAITREMAPGPTAELFLRRGELYRLDGNFSAALADYESAEQLDPGLATVALCQGRALFEAGHPGPARRALDEFLRRQPDHVAGFLLRARVQARLGARREAVADYGRAIALADEPRPEPFAERAEIQMALGEPAAALDGLTAGLAKLGSIPSLHLPALEAELALARFDAALSRIDRLTVAADRKEQWLERRAEVLVRAGRLAEAATARRTALEAVAALPARLREAPACRELELRLRAALE